MRIAFFCKQDFNLGAAYVIAYLKSIGHEVSLFLHYENVLGSLEDVSKFKPDLVCFSCVTANKDWALETARRVRKFSDVEILFGGVHPTLCPGDFEGFSVCRGDGIEYFGGKFEPDVLYPDRDIFFKQLPPVHRRYQIFMTGFGCPFRCSFCNNHQLHRKLIRRTVTGCIKELQYLKQRGMKYVLFDDDIFTINRDWILRFLIAYKHSVSLPFTCFGHTRFIDTTIAKALRDAYCDCVWLGIQSGNEHTRQTILNRPETNREIEKACLVIKEAGLKLMIDHIFGLPLNTYGKLKESYFFYKSLNPDVVNCYELLYFPKAEINKYGNSTAKYQKEGGHDYQRYAKSFTAIPLICN